MAAEEPLPKDFEKQSRQRFEEIANPELSFKKHLEIEKQEFHRRAQLERAPALKYKPGLPGMTPCGNGDFDKSLDPAEWQGAFGTLPLSGLHPFSNFTAGLYPGTGITDFNSHQTWVGAGIDLIVGIPLTAQGSSGAVRIGNAVNGYGCELLSKTFTVAATHSLIKFWYAIVLEDPGHKPPAAQPFFWVRVTDTTSDTVIPGAFDFGNGSDKIVADTQNPFFQSKKGTDVIYKDWSCGQINLSTQIGKSVTIEFVTGDCGYGGHYGYAYVDNFCGTCAGSPEGNITFDAAGSSKCGAGNLCFNYELPTIKTASGIITGTITITLSIYQNGVLMTQMTSPTLSSGTSYCFAITPSTMPLNPSLEGFDFVATGAFAIGNTTLAPMTVGAAPDGVVPGQNNDYQVACKFFSYAVKFVCGIQSDCECDCVSVRPGSYATEINIYNANDKQVDIRKRVVPVVLAGAPAGREPRVATSRVEDKIVLPAHSATMDDCCRIAELLLGAPAQAPMPLTIGFLEIVSPVELSVTAVYTATGLNGKNVSIDVEQIEAKIVRI
ncbi:MAG TPA: hypothetical protein VNZ48_23025 [Xanthobacteraceae bacterium]|jgi:hypothetical protein|nr:hypothetical protein [Xanthobacteraceae bacterium]